MTIEDITLAAFTLCNSLRIVAYVPQIVRAARDRSGAEAISFATWTLFLLSHVSAAAYALVNKEDRTMAMIFLCNAAGCGAILIIAACSRSRHRRPRPSGSYGPAIRSQYRAMPQARDFLDRSQLQREGE